MFRAPAFSLCLIFALFRCAATAQDMKKWGLIKNDPGALQGYTLFGPQRHDAVYLIDMQGRVVHKWETGERAGNSAYLLEDGRLMRATHTPGNEIFGAPPFGGGRIQVFGWDGKLEWNYRISDVQRYQHHDIEPLPNGNVLALVWEHKSREETIAAGRNPDLLEGDKLFPESIIEIKPNGPESGDIVWVWRLWDHLVQDFDPTKSNYGVVADHPERLDINSVLNKGSDWNHANSIAYSPELDQIIINMRSMSEFYVIDHSTTTDEAATNRGGKQGKGGDFLYRWGNPRVYGRGGEGARTLFVQHHPAWIPKGLPGAGDILVFNNGQGRPDGDYSTVDQIHPPVDTDGSYRLEPGKAFEPAKAVWTYVANPKSDFYSYFISGAQRLSNGNTLICSGANSRIFEVTPAGKIVWEYRSAVARPDAPDSAGGLRKPGDPEPDAAAMRGVGVFRATKYEPNYPGLNGKPLKPLAH